MAPTQKTTVLKRLSIGKGLRMTLLCLEDEPTESINRYYAQHESTGEEGADTIYVPPHWHKMHGEYHTVLEGRLEFTVDGKALILKAGDPVLYVPPRTVHSIKSFPGERTVAQERADPPGTYKIEYFNDALSSGDFKKSKAHLIRALYDGDGYLPLAYGFKPLEEVIMWVIATVARFFSPSKQKLL